MALNLYQRAALAMLAAHGIDPMPAGAGKSGSVTALPVAHSAIFDAARELLRAGADRSAAIAQLQASYPELKAADADKVLREAATMLHAAGEVHNHEGA